MSVDSCDFVSAMNIGLALRYGMRRNFDFHQISSIGTNPQPLSLFSWIGSWFEDYCSRSNSFGMLKTHNLFAIYQTPDSCHITTSANEFTTHVKAPGIVLCCELVSSMFAEWWSSIGI